jgi:hypothetical protein
MTDSTSEPKLPPRAVLDTWLVPELPDDFADRVVDAWRMETEPPARPAPRAARPWRRTAIAAVAGALAASIVFALLRPTPQADPETHGVEPVPPTSAVSVGPPPVAGEVDKVGLAVHVTPAGARVRIDGAEIAADPTGEHHVTAVVPGVHAIAISREGSLTIREEIDVPTRGLSLTRMLFSSNIQLEIDVVPSSAHVRVLDGEATIAELEGGGKLALPRDATDHYEIEASAPGYETTRGEVDIEGDLATASVTLPAVGRGEVTPRRGKTRDAVGGGSHETPKARTALLRIGHKRGVKPAMVFVDGVPIGKTPIASYKVTAGRHRIEWFWDDGRRITETTVLREGEVRTLKR